MRFVLLFCLFSFAGHGTAFSNTPPHRVTDNGVYRFWSTVSRGSNGGYLKRTPPAIVKCNGNDGTADEQLTLVTAHDHSAPKHKRYRFVLKNPNNPSNEYVVTGAGEGQDVYLQDVPKGSTPPKDVESLFEPEYFYSSTLFRCWNVNGRTNLYIGSDIDGNVTLVKRGIMEYPKPSVLFRLVVEN